MTPLGHWVFRSDHADKVLATAKCRVPSDPKFMMAPAVKTGEQVELVRNSEGWEFTLKAWKRKLCDEEARRNKGPTIVRMEEPGLPVTVNVRVGSVMPLLWSATGRAFLGFLNDSGVRRMAEAELAAATAAARQTLARTEPIGSLQAQVREQEVACVRDTYLPGISAVAAPIHDHTGRVIAVITALGASGGFDPSSGGVVASALRQEARDVSALLGFSAKQR